MILQMVLNGFKGPEIHDSGDLFLGIQESFVFLREMKVFAPPEGPLGPPHAKTAIFL